MAHDVSVKHASLSLTAHKASISGWSAVVWDGLVIPPDSILMLESGQDDTSASAAFLTDSTAAFGTDTYNTGYRVRNTSDGSTGVITDTTGTTIVATLSGGNDDGWDSGDYYEIVVDMDTDDRIHYQPTAANGVFTYKLYDDSASTYTAEGTVTIDAGGSGQVEMSVKGVPYILDTGALIGVNVAQLTLTTHKPTVQPNASTIQADVALLTLVAYNPTISPVTSIHEVKVNRQVPLTLVTHNATLPPRTETDTGGRFWGSYDILTRKQQRGRKSRAKARRKAKKIQNELDRALYLAEMELQAQEARETELARLADLVMKNKELIVSIGGKRIESVIDEAIEKQTFSATERMEREIRQLHDEETFIMMAAQILVNQ